MSGDHKDLQRVPNLSQQRERVVEQLKDAFSGGYLALTDFEARVSVAENALDVTALDGLVADLPLPAATTMISDSEVVNCKMTTKKLAGSVLRTRALNIESSMSTLKIDYLEIEPIQGVQEIRVSLNMSTLVLNLPDDVVVENVVEENMSTFKEYRNKYYNPVKPRTIIKITGTAKMSTIRIKRKRYWFFSRKRVP